MSGFDAVEIDGGNWSDYENGAELAAAFPVIYEDGCRDPRSEEFIARDQLTGRGIAIFDAAVLGAGDEIIEDMLKIWREEIPEDDENDPEPETVHPKKLAKWIMKAEPEDVGSLLVNYERAKREWRCDADHLIDFSDLPTDPIPDDVDTGYPVWLMTGNDLLTGWSADGAEYITLEEYRADR